MQIGIGGWQAPRAGVKVGRGRGTTIMTVGDVERVGIEKIAEMALEIAWKGAKAVYLSFDIDVIDAGFVPGYRLAGARRAAAAGGARPGPDGLRARHLRASRWWSARRRTTGPSRPHC